MPFTALGLHPSLVRATRALSLRYGENPHQKAAFYRWSGASGPDDAGLADATIGAA